MFCVLSTYLMLNIRRNKSPHIPWARVRHVLLRNAAVEAQQDTFEFAEVRARNSPLARSSFRKAGRTLPHRSDPNSLAANQVRVAISSR